MVSNTSYDPPGSQTGLSFLKPHPSETYQLIDKIGEGTYGTVYRAINKYTDELVAIKICPIDEDTETYYTELEALRILEHSAVIRLIDATPTHDALWLVLEYCSLGSVADILSLTGTPFTETEIALVVTELLSALEYVHSSQLIHRDLKPGNILITSSGAVKLTDFGIASQKPSSSTFRGSALWMAPEQVSRQSYSQKIDIWALGICIVQMAELKVPFQHLHPTRAMFAIQQRPCLGFEHPESYSEELLDFVSQCLVVDASQRATATELRQHPFVQKYSDRLSSIQQEFRDTKPRVIQNARVKRAHRSQQRPGSNDTSFVTNSRSRSNYLLADLSKDKSKSFVSNEPQTFIVHSSVDHSQQLEVSEELTGGKEMKKSQQVSSFSMLHNYSREVIAGGGGPFTRESIESIGKAPLLLQLNDSSAFNASIISNSAHLATNHPAPQHSLQEHSFRKANRKEFSPIPTAEGEEQTISSSRRFTRERADNYRNSKQHLQLNLGFLAAEATSQKRPHQPCIEKRRSNNLHKSINISNFVVKRGQQLESPTSPVDRSLDSDQSPLPTGNTTLRLKTTRKSVADGQMKSSPMQGAENELKQSRSNEEKQPDTWSQSVFYDEDEPIATEEHATPSLSSLQTHASKRYQGHPPTTQDSTDVTERVNSYSKLGGYNTAHLSVAKHSVPNSEKTGSMMSLTPSNQTFNAMGWLTSDSKYASNASSEHTHVAYFAGGREQKMATPCVSEFEVAAKNIDIFGSN